MDESQMASEIASSLVKNHPSPSHESLRSILPDILLVKEVAFIVFGMVPAALGLLLTDFVFHYLITALCPKCGGRSIYHASRKEKAVFGGVSKIPIKYHCQACGYIHRTRVFSGGKRIIMIRGREVVGAYFKSFDVAF